MTSISFSGTGILNDADIARLVEGEAVSHEKALDPDQIQPASLDLRLGSVAYRVRASFLPGPKCSVKDKLDQLQLHQVDLSHGAVLETGCVYIVPLMESLSLPSAISAAANPKSSTGRLDIFTRLITDHSRQFDKIPSGYTGPLYLEVSPRTFPIFARAGSRLTQIRFRQGKAALSDEEHLALHRQETLVASEDPFIDNGIAVSIDLAGEGIIGYRAKRHTAVIDVDERNALNMLDFWEPIEGRGKGEIILDPDKFYILVSREAVHVPPLYAAEMIPFDPLVGEFRVHYAGFFDPGFGAGESGGTGSRAVLEVRSHEVPFIVEHGQIIGRLAYERMRERPSHLYGQGIGSNYQAQGLKLSKHFRVAR
ncbi:2'-deoxycytidine 5'-triphosphate deaminase [uncultured Cohaesibacter sp.]|uniref:2'-deoxycytidine 5'-triphosphate deaminase n=1 Tax=uncultured Cohaesibacter sp. TaxID=1002546 RepID=UPI002931C3DC|nr:2'-deoxycytidine 5'-triphosphate deaminase [uncultured Cohaesibacter sp.]